MRPPRHGPQYQGLNQHGNLYLHIALGIYIGGLALAVTLTIISLVIGAVFMSVQEKAWQARLSRLQESFRPVQGPDLANGSGVETARNKNPGEISAEQAKFRCDGYRHRANFLAENISHGKTTDNYGSLAPMRDEMNALLDTLHNECAQ